MGTYPAKIGAIKDENSKGKLKTFLSDQCKEIEGKKRLAKTKDLFKKMRDTKETFHAKMGTIKERKLWT